MSLLLMIASIAIAVLPVWRSPMISSRWPRPIGIIASIAFRPVCIGSVTGWRCTTPGRLELGGAASRWCRCRPCRRAGARAGRRCARAGPRRPGSRAGAPVRLTVSPSRRCSQSPNSTAPTLSDSRFSARPVTPCGSSSISKDMQFSRPCRRAMPSATDSTVPTSVSSARPASSPSMRLLRMLVISSGLICMCFLGAGSFGAAAWQLPAQLLQSVADGGVEDRVADPAARCRRGCPGRRARRASPCVPRARRSCAPRLSVVSWSSAIALVISTGSSWFSALPQPLVLAGGCGRSRACGGSRSAARGSSGTSPRRRRAGVRALLLLFGREVRREEEHGQLAVLIERVGELRRAARAARRACPARRATSNSERA